ncbi:hypothetical protein J6590_034531 [Homalodisca vitripennis]|nr:hypothetical protein J6590_034531 [Homalodisca vitripennis]
MPSDGSCNTFATKLVHNYSTLAVDVLLHFSRDSVDLNMTVSAKFMPDKQEQPPMMMYPPMQQMPPQMQQPAAPAPAASNPAPAAASHH